VVACDLREEAPIWWLRVKQAAERGASLIVCNPRATRLDRYAKRIVRYPYGSEAATVLAVVNSLSAKRPELSEKALKASLLRETGEIAQDFSQAQNAVVIYGSEGLGVDGSQALAQACANLLIVTDHIGRPNNGLIAAWPEGNIQGAWDMGFRPLPDVKSAIQAAKALYIAAADPMKDDPSLAEAIQSAGFLVVQELFLTETAKVADIVLPAISFAEREGTYTSGERRVQRFYPAIPPRMGCLPDYAIAARIGQRLGFTLEDRSPMLVMGQIAGEVADYSNVSYPRLAEVVDQWPIVGRQDLYYGGTTYDNSQGLGVQLTPAAQRGESISLGWAQPPEVREAGDGLLAVPVTILFDHSQTVQASKVLRSRIPPPFVVLAPLDAAQSGIRHGDRVFVTLKEYPVNIPGEARIEMVTRLDESVPKGIVLVPRSMGLPVQGPSPVEIYVVEKVSA
jgi:NADH-quinone oxidoreductase subunit G